MKKAFVFLLLSISLAGCKSNTGYDNNHNGGNNYKNNNCDGSCSSDDYSDSGITYRVKQALMMDGSLSASSRFVSVSTTNGEVTLTGTVSSSSDMSAIVRKVKSVAGVRGVNNQMTVSNQ